MILEGNQRGGAKNLALHLMKRENEHIEVYQIKGFASRTVMGALNEAYAISRGTECKKFLYSLSLNPPPTEKVTTQDFVKAIDMAAKDLGLVGQPRVIVFHEKEGRQHCHCVWHRIDTEQMKAIHMPYDHRKLQDISRKLFLKHGWKMPQGFANKSLRNPKNFTLAEWQQAKRIGKKPNEIKEAIQDAWALSDNRASFKHALEERGYTLAKGDRKGRILAVDYNGEIFSIPKMTGLKIKQVRDRIGDEDDLPTITEAKQQIADNLLPVLEGFKVELEQKQAEQKTDYQAKRKALVQRQRQERQAFLEQIAQQQKQEALARQSRFRTGLLGIWDRLRGEHKRIQQLNALEAEQQKLQNQKAKDDLIASQLSERRKAAEHTSQQNRDTKAQQANLQRDYERIKNLPFLEQQRPSRTKRRRR